MWNKRGFTLLETLIVMMIASMMMLLALFGWGRLQDDLEEQRFLANFERNIQHIQQVAIIQEVVTFFRFSKQDGEITFYSRKNGYLTKIHEMKIPSAIEAAGSAETQFLRGSGNISKLTSYTFQLKNQQKKVTYQFQVGSGRFEIKTNSTKTAGLPAFGNIVCAGNRRGDLYDDV
ncbi:MAG: type II secretion system GspH family protein [Enterococcaceae bacterium]|jgi:competence protein ComGD|nr:type II secretion system GspH family protein [Enterococcaceae bacterium]MCI1919255.1 type II secretion system GspH family protein [Enterococcaceae bacterium]